MKTIFWFRAHYKLRGFTESVDAFFNAKPSSKDILKALDKIQNPPNMLLSKDVRPLKEFIELEDRAAKANVLIDREDIGYHISEEVVETTEN